MADTQAIGSTAESRADIKLWVDDETPSGVGRFAINGVWFVLRVWTPEEWAAIVDARARQPDHRMMTNNLRYSIEQDAGSPPASAPSRPRF